jgi:hypothetical protein
VRGSSGNLILSHADHMFDRDHADEVAPLILNHLEQALAAMASPTARCFS